MTDFKALDETLVVGPLQCNCRLLACPRTGDAVLIDPGAEPEKILSRLKGLKTANGVEVRVQYLFHTHAHFDHIGGTRGVKEGLSRAPKIALHRDDLELYDALEIQGQMFGIPMGKPAPVDYFYEHQEDIRVGDLKFSVIHTPGHSPGGVCLRLHEDKALGIGETLFSGDTLFQNSVGRTDLWGGDQELMFKSIKTRILTLDGDTRVCPGHGPETRVGIEKRQNPFL